MNKETLNDLLAEIDNFSIRRIEPNYSEPKSEKEVREEIKAIILKYLA